MIKSSKRLVINLSVIIIVIGVFFRIWDLGSHNFNGDESAHMRKAVSVARGIIDLASANSRVTAWQNIYLTILQHNHPPLEFLLLIPAVPFENRELVGRLIYLFVNLFFLFGCYLIAKKVYNKIFAMYLLLLLVTSTYFIWTSRFVTHDSLSIIAGTLIGLSIIALYNKKINSTKALLLLFASITLGLISFINFIFYLPIILIILVNKFNKRMNRYLFVLLFIFVVINSVFYVPYLIYSFSSDAPLNAGFNYYLNSKVKVTSIDIFHNIKTFYKDFFSKNGVFPLWVFALIGVFTLSKKFVFMKLFVMIILTFLIINVIKITTLNFYMEFYGLVVILACLWLVNSKKWGKWFLVLIVIFNIYGSLAIVKGDYSKATGPVIASHDNLKIVGMIAKKCLINNQSYISTVNPWRTFYYFGRPVLPGVEGGLWSPTLAIELFTKGEFRNEVFLIHYKKGELSQKLVTELKKDTIKEYIIGDDYILLFNQCNFNIL